MRLEKRKLIQPREWRFFWLVSGGLSLVAAIVTALAVLLGKPAVPADILPNQSPFRSDVASTIPHELFLNDFRFAQPGESWLSGPWNSPSDQGLNSISQQLKKYWIPPAQLNLLHLPEKNTQQIRRLLNEAP